MADTEAIDRYRAARQALRDNQRAEQAAGIDYETDEYLQLNAAVVEAEKNIPGWRRL